MFTNFEMEEYVERYEAMNDSADGGQNEEKEVIKRRKVDSPSPHALHLRPSSDFQLEIECYRVLNCSLSPTAVSENSDRAVSSSDDSSDALIKDSFRTSDLKEECFVTDVTKLTDGGFRETTPSPSSELSVDSERMMESSTPKKKKKPASSGSHRKPTKIPSAVEIEEFFSATEKKEQKRFSERYNYDIVKDVPLEGRYQWVKLKP